MPKGRIIGIAFLVGSLAGLITLRLHEGRPPNVILLSIDTLRADHLGVYGYTRATSPHIDALAGESMVFEQAISHAPSTLPAHASILTSLLPAHHGASVSRQTGLPDEVTTLAEVLREKGYATASFNGGMQLDPVYRLDQGFDLYESVRPKSASTEDLRQPEDRLSHVVERASAWFETVHGRPFFLFLHSYEVHHPYTPRDEFYVPSEAEYDGVVSRDISVAFLASAIRGEVPLDPRDRQRIVDAYDAEIRSADAAVGKLIEQLERADLLDETVLVLTSDHGEEFAERGWVGWHSHSLYDELLRIPLLIRLPGAEDGGRRVQEQVRGIDIAPTILDLLDVEIPVEFAGRSLVDAAARDADSPPAVSRRDTAPGDDVSLRTERWKLYGGRLYDLANDRAERTDVAAAHAAVASRLRETLDAVVRERELRTGVPVNPEPALIEGLRALGYLADSAEGEGPPRAGLTGAYYANADWSGAPVHRRLDARIDFDWRRGPTPLPAPFSMEWTGAIRIERAGRYTFHLESDDGSTLEIGDRLVVDNGGEHAIRSRSGQVELSEGVHPVRLRYFNKLFGGMLRLTWEPPGGPASAVPSEVWIPERG